MGADSGYKAEGYTGTGVGPIFVPREATLNDSRLMTLESQLARTKDPQERQRLMMQIAVERKYASQSQAAQQQVQSATLGPAGAVETEAERSGGPQRGFISMPSAHGGFGPAMQSDPMAMMRRKLMQQKAEQERAAALGIPMTLRGDL